MGIKIADLPIILDLVNTSLSAILNAAAADAKAKGKDEITHEELKGLLIKERTKVTDQLKSIAGSTPNPE